MKSLNIKLLVFAILVMLGGSVFAALYFNKSDGPPLIQGVVLAEPQPLDGFSLQDHTGERFNNASLRGRWHIVSYGYTDCPDICPTVLSELSKLERQLASDDKFTDMNVLFYTIDPQRDTNERLAKYIPYFSDNFVGLAPGDQYADALPFERSLGIQAGITPLPPEENHFKGYTVSHGTMMYLLNPKAELQAIFKPETAVNGAQSFKSTQLYADYVALRRYYE